MMRGEKMLSFVKYEKLLESDYRRALDDIKRPDEIWKVFVEYAFKLLKMVKEDLPDKMKKEIRFVPGGKDEVFKLSDQLLDHLGELVEKSDLLAIINRMASSALHRYKKLKSDNERTDLFRLGENARAH